MAKSIFNDIESNNTHGIYDVTCGGTYEQPDHRLSEKMSRTDFSTVNFYKDDNLLAKTHVLSGDSLLSYIPLSPAEQEEFYDWETPIWTLRNITSDKDVVYSNLQDKLIYITTDNAPLDYLDDQFFTGVGGAEISLISNNYYTKKNVCIANFNGEIGGIIEQAFQDNTYLEYIKCGCEYIEHTTFASCYELQYADFPYCKYLGDSVFSSCTSLKSINLPNCTYIDVNTFESCLSLAYVDLPKCEYIGNYAFYYCYSLTSVTIPNSVTSIGESAFDSCSSLTSISIPNSVDSINNYTFSDCTGLTSVTIPNSVSSIGESAFYNCTSLTSVLIDSDYITNKVYTSNSNIKNIFGQQVKEYIFGSNITAIGENAFNGADNLITLTIPENITRIDDYAFLQCSQLTSITVLNETPQFLGNGALSGTNSCPIYVPANSVSTYKTAGGWAAYADRITAI